MIVNPIFVNIFLHELDVYMEGLKNEYNRPKLITCSLTEESELKSNKSDKELKIRKFKNNIKYLKTDENKTVKDYNRKLMYIRHMDD